jgi:hypothetical protein
VSAVLEIALLWAAAGILGLVIAVETAVGPVIVRFGHGHGVHLGDLVGVAAVSSPAALASVGVVRRRRPRGQSHP